MSLDDREDKTDSQKDEDKGIVKDNRHETKSQTGKRTHQDLTTQQEKSLEQFQNISQNKDTLNSNIQIDLRPRKHQNLDSSLSSLERGSDTSTDVKVTEESEISDSSSRLLKKELILGIFIGATVMWMINAIILNKYLEDFYSGAQERLNQQALDLAPTDFYSALELFMLSYSINPESAAGILANDQKNILMEQLTTATVEPTSAELVRQTEDSGIETTVVPTILATDQP